MSQFQKNLQSLPGIGHIERLELVAENNTQPMVIIDNKPGKAGSVAVYHSLKLAFGQLTPEAAKAGLEIFAEHVASATESPGLHPNIDRLFDIIENNRTFSIHVINKKD